MTGDATSDTAVEQLFVRYQREIAIAVGIMAFLIWSAMFLHFGLIP